MSGSGTTQNGVTTQPTGIGLQPDYGLRNEPRSQSQACDVGTAGDYVGTLAYTSIGGNTQVQSGPSALSKLQTLSSWLDQFPEDQRGLYLSYVARDPQITTLVNLSNQEISCLAQGLSCTFCYGSPANNSAQESTIGGSCPCPPSSSSTTVPPAMVALAKQILAIRSTFDAPSQGRCEARTGPKATDSGCANLKAFEWTTATGLPLASGGAAVMAVDEDCATVTVPSAEICANFVQTQYNGSWSAACNQVKHPQDVDAFAEAICGTLADTECLASVDCNVTTNLDTPYCQCLNATKVATYNAQATAAKCCYFAPTPPPPPAKKSSTGLIVGIVIGIVVILVLAIAIPMGLKAKRRNAVLRAAMLQAQQQQQQGSPPSHTNPLVDDMTYEPDEQSSILPAPTQF